MTTSRTVFMLATILSASSAGCRSDPAVPVAEVAGLAAHDGDAKVLVALDPYDPMYKLDATGHVTHLRLTSRHLSAAALTEIGKLADLQSLDLYGATVTDEGVAQLKPLQKLRSLGLGAAPITDQALVHLEMLSSLQWVWVPRTTITDAAIDQLKVARPDLNVYPL